MYSVNFILSLFSGLTTAASVNIFQENSWNSHAGKNTISTRSSNDQFSNNKIYESKEIYSKLSSLTLSTNGDPSSVNLSSKRFQKRQPAGGSNQDEILPSYLTPINKLMDDDEHGPMAYVVFLLVVVTPYKSQVQLNMEQKVGIKPKLRCIFTIERYQISRDRSLAQKRSPWPNSYLGHDMTLAFVIDIDHKSSNLKTYSGFLDRTAAWASNPIYEQRVGQYDNLKVISTIIENTGINLTWMDEEFAVSHFWAQDVKSRLGVSSEGRWI
ncbi:MAG: hypothetical protein M1829_005483 [Trizodia sp. TS-e1964]|nr:MAG: hypothetical protein M1829_005483 [Trizodia sp. TS-e1964]